jgi:tRNA (guanine26-N2/guanine27-N2)-dimethyltransferase
MASVAAKHDIGIRILFSHSTDHYIRVYAQIGYGCQKADESLKSTGYILHCFGCMHREITCQIFSKSNQCPECGAKMEHAGPLWVGSISDQSFIDQIIKENQNTAFKKGAKITKLLTLTKAEATEPPTYYVIDKLSGKLNLPAPSNQAFLAALQHSGFQAVQTHFNPRSIKTNAPALAMHKTLRDLVTPK